jgi:hypothetical protein
VVPDDEIDRVFEALDADAGTTAKTPAATAAMEAKTSARLPLKQPTKPIPIFLSTAFGTRIEVYPNTSRNGTTVAVARNQVKSLSQWVCRRTEVSAALQRA